MCFDALQVLLLAVRLCLMLKGLARYERSYGVEQKELGADGGDVVDDGIM